MSDSDTTHNATVSISNVKDAAAGRRDQSQLAMAVDVLEGKFCAAFGDELEDVDSDTLAAALLLASTRFLGPIFAQEDRAAAGKAMGALLRGMISTYRSEWGGVVFQAAPSK